MEYAVSVDPTGGVRIFVAEDSDDRWAAITLTPFAARQLAALLVEEAAKVENA